MQANSESVKRNQFDQRLLTQVTQTSRQRHLKRTHKGNRREAIWSQRQLARSQIRSRLTDENPNGLEGLKRNHTALKGGQREANVSKTIRHKNRTHRDRQPRQDRVQVDVTPVSRTQTSTESFQTPRNGLAIHRKRPEVPLNQIQVHVGTQVIRLKHQAENTDMTVNQVSSSC